MAFLHTANMLQPILLAFNARQTISRPALRLLMPAISMYRVLRTASTPGALTTARSALVLTFRTAIRYIIASLDPPIVCLLVQITFVASVKTGIYLT